MHISNVAPSLFSIHDIRVLLKTYGGYIACRSTGYLNGKPQKAFIDLTLVCGQDSVRIPFQSKEIRFPQSLTRPVIPRILLECAFHQLGLKLLKTRFGCEPLVDVSIKKADREKPRIDSATLLTFGGMLRHIEQAGGMIVYASEGGKKKSVRSRQKQPQDRIVVAFSGPDNPFSPIVLSMQRTGDTKAPCIHYSTLLEALTKAGLSHQTPR